MQTPDDVHPPEEEPRRSEQPTIAARSSLWGLRSSHGDAVDPRIDLEQDTPRSGRRSDRPSGTHRYSVHDEVARGGMGAIFRVRDEDLRRSLAMKVLLGAGDRGTTGATVDPDRLARFLEEAQVTAQLSHPGVVPVHELGVDATGRAFFTMTLVRGKTLGEVIESARAERDGWDRAKALQTLLRVCQTMAFAHSKQVIHRDLKPANVMVGRFGQVYVMDWGLAKVMGETDRHDIRIAPPIDAASTRIETRRVSSAPVTHETPLMTMDGAVVGTPCYMPPEQARGQVDDVGARSDVYAIGAMLYELLTGRPPYIDPGSQLSPHTVLASVNLGPPSSVHTLAPDTPPELEAICEKAMARDKQARYADANALADDLQRYLSGHVVLAHKTGAIVELRKWVLRNKKEAATAAAALLAIAGISAYFMGSLKDERDRAQDAEVREAERADEADRQRARAETAEASAMSRAAEAERERARAEELADFMLVDLRDGLVPLGRLDLLAQVARRSQEYYESLPDEDVTPDVRSARALALSNVGDVQMLLGDLPGARRSYESALAIVRRLTDVDATREHWQRQLATGHLQVGDVQVAQGRLDDARASYDACLAISQRLADADPSDGAHERELALAHDRIGNVHKTGGRPDDAVASFQTALDIRRRLSDSDPANTTWLLDLSVSHVKVGDMQGVRGLLTDAGASFEASRAIRQRLCDADPDNTVVLRELATSHVRIGNVHKAQGDLVKALASFEQGLSVKQRLSDADPTNTLWLRDLSVSHNKIGDVHRAARREDDALVRYEAALAIRQRLSDADPSNSQWLRDLALSHTRVGNIQKVQGRLPEARSSYVAAQEIRRRLCDSDPTNATWQADLSVSHHKLGDVWKAEGRLEEARQSFAASLEIAQTLSDASPSDVDRLRALSVCHYKLGTALAMLARYDDAVAQLSAAEEVHRRAMETAPHLKREHHKLERRLHEVRLHAGDRSPETSADHISLGHARHRERRFGDAAAAFEKGLADETQRADLDQACLFAGACAAARAASEGGDPSWRGKAWSWLGEDLRRRTEAVNAAEASLAGDVPDDERKRLLAARAKHLAHIDRAWAADPDLESLRGTSEFDALFEGVPRSDD